ncbi:tRNA (adenosine(37)-N6)-threonylcarbamoyltransferase complex ATPase subunit type 1 TsaE [Salinisphaera sp. SPP-AMP-43]|uniref:tRNA (adenosine(37)-N6)-threonylcarbamoyltransferase complex ATPase subunit type 1 TsaE n=1 Tax=Salinisphaera sp. SPP-AMP-43 TaxID=3121288 RepID=UPI003C6DBA1B
MVELPGPDDTDALGAALAQALGGTERGVVITLAGELGAGKTALVRAVLSHLGHDGPVVSPSYTLIEPYELSGRRAYHLDLYRLGDPEELEFLGIRDLVPESDWVFVEWAEKGEGFLPAQDLAVTLSYRESGRAVQLRPCSAAGRAIVAKLQ